MFHVAADTSMWSGHKARQQRINVEGALSSLPLWRGGPTAKEVFIGSVPRPLPAFVFCLAAGVDVARAALTGKEPEMTPEGMAIALARARVVSRRAERELGYRPAPLRTMIEDPYRWLVAEGIIPPR